MEEIGPVEYMIVSFPGNRFTGEIAPALGKLVESNTIRIIDLAFASKDADGNVAAFELSDIDEEVRRGLEALGLEATGLLGEEDLMDAADALEPGSSAAMLLWEDIWAGRARVRPPRRRRRARRHRSHPTRCRHGGARGPVVRRQHHTGGLT